MCPIHFFCLFLVVRIMALSSPITVGTSSFVICSVQLIFSILLHIHISKASNLFISSFLMVHILKLHISVFIIRFFLLMLCYLMSFYLIWSLSPLIQSISYVIFYINSCLILLDLVYVLLCHPLIGVRRWLGGVAPYSSTAQSMTKIIVVMKII